MLMLQKHWREKKKKELGCWCGLCKKKKKEKNKASLSTITRVPFSECKRSQSSCSEQVRDWFWASSVFLRGEAQHVSEESYLPKAAEETENSKREKWVETGMDYFSHPWEPLHNLWSLQLCCLIYASTSRCLNTLHRYTFNYSFLLHYTAETA